MVQLYLFCDISFTLCMRLTTIKNENFGNDIEPRWRWWRTCWELLCASPAPRRNQRASGPTSPCREHFVTAFIALWVHCNGEMTFGIFHFQGYFKHCLCNHYELTNCCVIISMIGPIINHYNCDNSNSNAWLTHLFLKRLKISDIVVYWKLFLDSQLLNVLDDILSH